MKSAPELRFDGFPLSRYKGWRPSRGHHRIRACVRQTLGLISVLLTAAPAAAAGSRTVVLEGLDLPGHMAEYHDRTRTALEGVVRGNGRAVVSGEGPRWCTTPDCFRAVARAADAGD